MFAGACGVQDNPGGTKDDFETYFGSLTVATANEFKKQAAALKKVRYSSLAFLTGSDCHPLSESMNDSWRLAWQGDGRRRGWLGREGYADISMYY